MGDTISGNIPEPEKIVCVIGKPKRMMGVFSKHSDAIKGTVTGDTPADEIYAGSYVITPNPHEDGVLETRLKYMDEDVTIKKIPYAEVSNLSGGKTATIG